MANISLTTTAQLTDKARPSFDVKKIAKRNLMKKPNGYSLPIKIIGLFIFIIGSLLSIAWIIESPSDFEPWTVFLFAVAALMWDGVAILNEVKQVPEQEEQTHQNIQPTLPKRHNTTQIKLQDNSENNFPSNRPFHMIAVLLVGGVASITASLAFLAVSEVMFYISLLPAIIVGVICVFLVDTNYEMEKAKLWKRLLLAIIVGALGGILGIVILILLIIAAFIKYGSERPFR